jgi:acyl-CoA reductase-like NAD-dependent aldehyde dehydrogenase
VGRIVAELAARHLKPVLLELGGKAPLLALDDANLEEAASAAAFGAFMNQGQICMSTERLIVDDSVADAFVALITRKASTLLAGNPRTGQTPLGPVVGADAIDRIDGIVKDAVSKGARIIAGGRIDGTYMDATVVDHVTPNMRIYAEECFGPVVAIIRVHGDDEAIRVANDTEYGLSSAVFSRDLQRAMRAARRIEAGICHINGPTVDDEPQMPFGGMKASGYGRFGGAAAVEEFTELRWITFATQPRRYPI